MFKNQTKKTGPDTVQVRSIAQVLSILHLRDIVAGQANIFKCSVI